MAKRFFITAVAVFISMLSIAQTQHLTFMGIPIDGTGTAFSQKLKAKGFTGGLDATGNYSFKGKFAGYSGSEVYVGVSPKTKKVYKVIVFLPKETSWYGIKRQYADMRESYSKKYTLSSHYEYFMTPYYEGDGYEEQAVRLEKCSYVSFYTDDRGAIMLKISKYMQLQIVYEDVVNQQQRDDEESDALLQEI